MKTFLLTRKCSAAFAVALFVALHAHAVGHSTIGSAQLTNEIETSKKELIENLPRAIEAFVAKIKALQL